MSKHSKINIHSACYQIGGITIQVHSDLPITPKTFAEKFVDFEVPAGQVSPSDNQQNQDVITIHLHFSLPPLDRHTLGKKLYHKIPWGIYKNDNTWTYVGITDNETLENPYCIAVFNADHTQGHIYYQNDQIYRKGELQSLTMFTSDQILLSRTLAHLKGCYFHSSGAIINNKGLLFVGQSGAGKSTISRMLDNEQAIQVLCDDRNIVRNHGNGFHVYGTWNHGEWPVVSAAHGPLQAVLFLEQSPENRIVRMNNRREIIHRLLGRLIKPLETPEWWEQMFTLLEQIAADIPCYRLYFDTSGQIIEQIRRLCDD